MNYIILNTKEYNGKNNGTSFFYAAEILSGQYIGKFATSENALNEFPEIFKTEPYEVVELDPTAFEVDYTPPALSTYRVAIPSYWEMLFPNDRFIVGGFDIPLERTKDNVLCVDVAYLEWKAFQNELDKPENAALKRHMEVVWDYIKLQIENNNFV
jgi:hypothetical protein